MPTARPTAHTATATRRRAPVAPDAIKLLKDDHAEVKKLFSQYDKLSKAGAASSERETLALTICDMLVVHTTLEEELFYPAAREALDDEDDLVDEATVEHASAKDLIAQIQSSDPDDDLYDAKVKVLGEYIAHHVKEEHEELFPKVKPKLDTKALGAEMLQRKNELMAKPH